MDNMHTPVFCLWQWLYYKVAMLLKKKENKVWKNNRVAQRAKNTQRVGIPYMYKLASLPVLLALKLVHVLSPLWIHNIKKVYSLSLPTYAGVTVTIYLG